MQWLPVESDHGLLCNIEKETISKIATSLRAGD